MPHNDAMEVFYNQYTLLLAFSGQSAACEKALEKIINAYQAAFTQTGNTTYLDKMVQPSINLARFYRLTGRKIQYQHAIQHLQPANGSVVLGELTVRLDSLSPDYSALIKHVVFVEKIKEALDDRAFSELTGIVADDNQDDSFVDEVRVIALMASGLYKEAEDLIIARLEVTQGYSRLVFYYRLHELMVLSGEDSKAAAIADTFRQIVLKASDAPLAYLVLFAQHLRLSPDREAVQHLVSLYEKLGEELHLGVFLADMYPIFDMTEVTCQLDKLARETHYSLIKKRIDAIRGKTEHKSDVSVLEPLKNCFFLFFEAA